MASRNSRGDGGVCGVGDMGMKKFFPLFVVFWIIVGQEFETDQKTIIGPNPKVLWAADSEHEAVYMWRRFVKDDFGYTRKPFYIERMDTEGNGNHKFVPKDVASVCSSDYELEPYK